MKFENYGNEIIQTSNENMARTFDAMETLSQTVTAFIKEQSDNGYPSGFVKIPDTEYHLAKAKGNANACKLFVCLESNPSSCAYFSTSNTKHAYLPFTQIWSVTYHMFLVRTTHYGTSFLYKVKIGSSRLTPH